MTMVDLELVYASMLVMTGLCKLLGHKELNSRRKVAAVKKLGCCCCVEPLISWDYFWGSNANDLR